MAYREGVSISCGNDSPGLCRAALRSGEIEPHTDCSAWRSYVIETDINVALSVIAILGSDVGSRAGQVRHRQLADPKVQILNPGAVAAHVKIIEIVNMNILAPVIAFAGPEPGIRLAL